ncbi:MAG: ATP-binding protein [Chloroflexi bacterium]|nr:ATP-binding protein [Chloroflexota bacterium]
MSSVLPKSIPPPPRSIAETDLSLEFLCDLVIKTIHTHSVLTGQEVADSLKLPFPNIIEKVLDHLRHGRLLDVKGSEGLAESSRQYVVARLGSARVRELMDLSQYVGPAPVSLDAYVKMVNTQARARKEITTAALRTALAQLVLSDTLIEQLGPAVNAVKSVFLFGNTGNGKTSIGLNLGTLLPGTIWVPYTLNVQGQIVKIFDPLRHRVVSSTLRDDALPSQKSLLSRLDRAHAEGEDAVPIILAGQRYDERWVLIRRPLIVGGGEMTLQNLDLIFDPQLKYYEAPQQLKANGGVFLLDDLGRQSVSPREILNRWIVPLEKRVDYLKLRTGHKFQVPFEVLVIFATNLNPADLIDESFLRRIRSKIHVADPTWDQFREIFKREADKRQIPYSEDVFQHLVMEYYLKPKRTPRGAHPRDLLDALVDIARFRQVAPTMSNTLIDAACESYLLKEPQETTG